MRCRNFKRDILSLNLKEWSVEDAKRHPVLHRTVDKATVEMVHLPDIFIQVSVHCINCLIRLFLDISKKFKVDPFKTQLFFKQKFKANLLQNS